MICFTHFSKRYTISLRFEKQRTEKLAVKNEPVVTVDTCSYIFLFTFSGFSVVRIFPRHVEI